MGKIRPALVTTFGNAAMGRRTRRRRDDDGLVTVTVTGHSASEPGDGATLLTGARPTPPERRVPGVVVCHPAGQSHRDQHRAGWWPVPRALALSGDFVCLACDLGDGRQVTGVRSGPHSWGNDYSLARLDDAVDFLQSRRGGARPGPVLLAATSMGAVVALNWARRHRAAVAGVLLGCPVLDLELAYREDRGGLGASIAAAYGVRAPAPLPDPDTHSPARYAADLAGLPIRIYATGDDPVASDAGRCRQWAESVGDTVSVIDLGPGGHSPVQTPVADALRFASGVG